MTPEHLEAILIRHGIVDADAIEDPEYYDHGATVERISKALPDIIKAVDARSNELHRRLQRAESIISQAKLVENRPSGPVGRSLGRALANYAAAIMKEDRDRWQSACEQRTNERNRLGVEIEGVKHELAAVKAERDALREQIGQKLSACSCAAIMDTPETHEQAKIERDNPFWSPAYEDVMRRTGECIQLRADIAFLADRASRSGSVTFGPDDFRDTGHSSNSIVAIAYGMKTLVQQFMPGDMDDLRSCRRAWEKLPDHRKTEDAIKAMERAEKAVRR